MLAGGEGEKEAEVTGILVTPEKEKLQELGAVARSTDMDTDGETEKGNVEAKEKKDVEEDWDKTAVEEAKKVEEMVVAATEKIATTPGLAQMGVTQTHNFSGQVVINNYSVPK